MFERSSTLGAYTGKTGFAGPVLDPGTYDVSATSEIHKVECATFTAHEALAPLTKDGIPIGLNVYVRFHADCTDDGVEKLLNAMPVDKSNTVTARRIYRVYLHPEVGEAVRHVFSPVLARELCENREALLEDVRTRLLRMILQRNHDAVVVQDVYLSDVTFPPDVQKANVELAVQAALRDKAAAERDRVAAEAGIAKMRLEQRASARQPADPAATRAEPAADNPATGSEANDAQHAADDNPYP
jgi:regulator of protease activity HflC (stomatin/prohibitin superfamily)